MSLIATEDGTKGARTIARSLERAIASDPQRCPAESPVVSWCRVAMGLIFALSAGWKQVKFS
jgi:hypothetical protein